MKSKLYTLLIITLLFSINNTTAQGCDGDDPVGTDSLSKANIKVFGYLQPEYDYHFEGGDNENTFRFRRARIGVRGEVYQDFSYYFMLEASPFIGSTGDAYLMDAFVTYTKYNWAKVSLGSFKQPFSLDVATPCNSLTTIDRSIVADQLVAPQRDFGLMILGGNKYTKFNYWFAIMNGRGLQVKDDNTKKDIIGRVTYKVTNNLTIGGSFRYGYPIPNNEEDTRTSYGGEFLLQLDKLNLQGEYIYDEGAYFSGTAGGCGSTPVALGERRDGAYLMASYNVDENIQPVFKYEFFDPNLDLKDDGSYMERMTIGINYFFNDKVRFQLNYQANIQTVVNVDDDVLLAQVQLKF
ncbi:porin [Flavobacteriaceae bacterium SZ-1-7]|uniref:porin n=1 Tax=Tamlana sedimenti TaxID=3134126 RepID=UPI00312A438B